MKKHALNKWLFLLIFTFLLSLTLGLASFSVQRTSFADEYSYNVFSPNDLSENYPLSSPTDVLFFNGNVAITENPDKIVLYINGKYLDPISVAGATSLDQLCLLNENTLLVLSFNTIYKLSLVDYSVSILTDNNGAPVTCTHYDTNGKYLVAGSSNEGSARIYTVEGDKVIRSDYTIDGINGNKPVAIDNDLLIYVKNEKIYSRSLTDLSVEPALLTELNPERILVSREYYFFSLSGKIFKYNKLTKELNEFSVKNTYPNAEVYQLGHLGDLSNISFRGDNIAVTSLANNTIQEFKVIDNTLEFTGYAIANNKTAYNRFINVSDIQKFGDKVAILDGLKLSIVNPSNDNPYSPDKFNNLFVNEKVSHFAIGEYSIVYFSENGKINYYDLNAKSPDDAITFITDAKSFCDITYRFGKYYFITTDGLNSYFYTLDEETKELSKKDYSSPDFSLVEVDVFGNVYTVDQNNLLINDVVYTSIEDVIKIQTDFAGNLYALKNGKISKLNRNTKQFDDCDIVGNVNNFALSFDTKTVYYTLANSELIYSTNSLDNVSINSTILPNDFVLSGTSANIDNLKVYSINEGSVVYSVTHTDGHFVYNKLITPLSQYAFICDLNYDGIVYKCLAGVNGLILVYDNYLTEQVITTEELKQTVFVTTTVHAYYLPLITIDGAHYLSNQDSKVILNKHSQVNTLYKLNVSDRDFYYVCLDEDNMIFAYVPLDFTVKTLSKDVVINEFTIEDFKSPTLFVDAEMTKEFTSFSEVTSLKVLSTKNGVAKILYHTEDGDLILYADSSLIIDAPATWIRNVLIILALVTSVAGTTTYFLLRRKIKD